MTTRNSTLLAIAGTAIGLLMFALYLQHIRGMQPCPLCVIQRYLFAVIAILSLVATLLPPSGARVAAGISALTAIAGTGVAGWHIHIKANPEISCGIDPLETSLNTFPTADWLPFLFKADGLCSTDYAPILGLSIPQWSLLWFALLGAILIRKALVSGQPS